MLIIPAIDIRNGNCVRLLQGNYAQETIYGIDPVVVAQRWQSEGAKALHIVDLDGAKTSQLTNFAVIQKIAQAIKIPIQVGGGVQSENAVEQLLSVGVSKVIISTLALENEVLLKKLLVRYAERVIVSLDSKNGRLTKRGWLEETTATLVATAQRLEALGVQSFIFTDVLKDGTLTQPNYASITELLTAVTVPIVVAGGISTLSDLRRLQSLNVAGAIVGKALYEDRINLQEANNVS